MYNEFKLINSCHESVRPADTCIFHADGIAEHCHHDDGERAGVCERGEAGERGEGVKKAEGQSCRNPSGVEDKAAVEARCGGGVKTPPYEGRIQWRQP